MSTLGDIGADRVTGPESSDLRAAACGCNDGSGYQVDFVIERLGSTSMV